MRSQVTGPQTTKVGRPCGHPQVKFERTQRPGRHGKAMSEDGKGVDVTCRDDFRRRRSLHHVVTLEQGAVSKVLG